MGRNSSYGGTTHAALRVIEFKATTDSVPLNQRLDNWGFQPINTFNDSKVSVHGHLIVILSEACKPAVADLLQGSRRRHGRAVRRQRVCALAVTLLQQALPALGPGGCPGGQSVHGSKDVGRLLGGIQPSLRRHLRRPCQQEAQVLTAEITDNGSLARRWEIEVPRQSLTTMMHWLACCAQDRCDLVAA